MRRKIRVGVALARECLLQIAPEGFSPRVAVVEVERGGVPPGIEVRFGEKVKLELGRIRVGLREDLDQQPFLGGVGPPAREGYDVEVAEPGTKRAERDGSVYVDAHERVAERFA